jgi:hypothetical protein
MPRFISNGTLATCIHQATSRTIKDYVTLDRIRAAWITWVDSQAITFPSWQRAWTSWYPEHLVALLPPERPAPTYTLMTRSWNGPGNGCSYTKVDGVYRDLRVACQEAWALGMREIAHVEIHDEGGHVLTINYFSGTSPDMNLSPAFDLKSRYVAPVPARQRVRRRALALEQA